MCLWCEKKDDVFFLFLWHRSFFCSFLTSIRVKTSEVKHVTRKHCAKRDYFWGSADSTARPRVKMNGLFSHSTSHTTFTTNHQIALHNFHSSRPLRPLHLGGHFLGLRSFVVGRKSLESEIVVGSALLGFLFCSLSLRNHGSDLARDLVELGLDLVQDGVDLGLVVKIDLEDDEALQDLLNE